MKKKEFRSTEFTIKNLSIGIREQNISPTDIIEFCFSQIKKLNHQLNSFITIIDEENIYHQAEILKKEIDDGLYRGPLHGIPFTIKDIIFAKGIKLTAGSIIFSEKGSLKDAFVVEKMKESGAILLGTNNLNEFASGITGKNPFYGDSRNPWNLNCISGGSSSGSATSVASQMTLASLGTDTGGSIRVPAALCGVVGFKPTFNIINRNGVLPLSPSLDHIGIITRCVEDANIVFQHISKSSVTKIQDKFNFCRKIEDTNNKIVDHKYTLCIPQNYFYDFIRSDVRDVYHDFIESMIKSQFKIKRITLKNVKKYLNSWRVIRLSEASEIHEKLMKIKGDYYSKEVKEMLIQGTKFKAIEYIRSLKQTKEIKKEFAILFESGVDAIITPTTIIPATSLNNDSVKTDEGREIRVRDALLKNTIVFNSTGLPCISIPIGIVKEVGFKLPLGIQITGKPFSEKKIIEIAKHIENKNNSIEKFLPPLTNL